MGMYGSDIASLLKWEGRAGIAGATNCLPREGLTLGHILLPLAAFLGHSL